MGNWVIVCRPRYELPFKLDERRRNISTWARVTGTEQVQVPCAGIGMEMGTRGWGHPGYSVLSPLPAQIPQGPTRAQPGPHLPEGLVGRPKPAHVATGREDQQPDQGQAEVGS